MAEIKWKTYANFGEEELGLLSKDDIERVECLDCENEWTPGKHPNEMNRLTCSDNDCMCQNKKKLRIHYDGEALMKAQEAAEEEDPENEPSGPPEPELPPEEPAERRERRPTGEVFKDPVEQAADEFEDFLNDRNTEMGGSIKEAFISMMVADVQEYQQFPSPQSFAAIIDQAKSGISNKHQIQWLVNRYQRWLDARFGDQAANVVGQEFGVGGGWGQNGGQQAGVGSVGGTAYGSFSNGQNGQGGGWGNGGSGPGAISPGQNQGGSQMDPAVQQMLQSVMETQKELARELREMKADDGGPDGAMSQLKQMVEMQEMVEQLQGGSGGDDRDRAVQQLQSQIQQLQGQIQNQGPSGAVGSAEEAMLMRFSQRDDVSPSEIADVASKLGVNTDPAVREKEMEIELEREKMNQKQQRTEQVVGAFDGIIQNLGTAIGEGLTSGGDDDDGGGGGNPPESADVGQNAPAPQPNPQQSQGQMGGQPQDFDMDEVMDPQPEPWDCPNCGFESQNDPNVPGVECPKCDFSIVPCSFCQSPVEVPPRGDCPYVMCGNPDCQTAIERDDGDEVECPECEWEGGLKDTSGEMVVCDGCDSDLPVVRQQPPVEG